MKLAKRFAALGATGLILALSACAPSTEPAAQATPTPSEPTIKAALRSCGVISSTYVTLGDNGRTVTLQGQPAKNERGLKGQDIKCVLNKTSIPDSVVAQMNSTRALDGMQKASWETFAATWTYHPDNGVKVILTESK